MWRNPRRFGYCAFLMLLVAALGAKAQQYVSISGVAQAGSAIFPPNAVGSSTTQTVQVTLGTNLYINSITIPQSVGGKQEFTVNAVSGCVLDGETLNNNGSICSVTVTFTPAYAGVRSQPLLLDLSANYYDPPGTDYEAVGLSGLGLAPLAVVAPGIATLLQPGLSTPSYEYLFGSGMAADGAGNAYAAIPRSQVVVKIDKDTSAISTVVGSPVLGSLSYPTAVAADAAGDLFVAYANVVIEKPSGENSLASIANEEDGYGGSYGFSGDGGPGYLASLASPAGLALDATGNLYIGDTQNERIRKVDANTEIITTYAGSGSPGVGGYGGDGGPASDAVLNSPFGLATDSAGNLYIADYGNNRIRKVTASTQIITTVVGTGAAGYTGDGGLATDAELNGPLAVSLDAAGNLYITDSGNDVVRKVDAATNKIYTVAGGGSTALTTAGQTEGATSVSLAQPSGVAVDSLGSLYVSSSANSQIFKIAPTTGSIAFPHQTLVNYVDTADNPELFYLSNDGTQPFALAAPSSGTNPVLPSSFSVDNASACQPLLPGASPRTITAGDTCVFALDFTPATLGPVTGTLTVTDTAPSATQTMSLSGTGGTASTTALSLAFTCTPTDSCPSYTSSDTLTATVSHTSVGATSPIDGTVTFYANGVALPGGSNIAVANGVATFVITQLLQPASYTLTASFTPGSTSNLDPSTASIMVVVYGAYPGITSVTIDNHVYDGNPHGVTVVPNPPSLTTTIYYQNNNSSSGPTAIPPTLPGVYTAEVYINGNADYYPSYFTVYLHIYALPATVTINSITVPYGTPVPTPTVTTSPAGLSTGVLYSNANAPGGYSITPPTAIGTYLMSAGVTTPGYGATGFATLEIYSPTMKTSTWIVNHDSTVSHLSSAGAVLSTTGTPTGNSTLGGVAIDSSGDAWAVTNASNSVLEVSSSGTLLGTYTGGGLLAPVAVTIDGLGNPWIVNSGDSVTVLSPAGAVASQTGYLATSAGEATPLSAPTSIAIDSTGSVWITNSGDSSVTRVFGAAAPVLAPVAGAVVDSSLGVRP